MTTIRKWEVVITPKYIPASLLTVSRMFGTFVSRYIALESQACVMTSKKTAMSEGSRGQFEE